MVAREWIELQALKLTNYRALTKLVETGIPGPEGSVSKLHWSEQKQRLTKLALEIQEGEADEFWRHGPAPRARQHDRGRDVGDPPQHHRRARARPPEEPIGCDSPLRKSRTSCAARRASLLDEREPTWEELAELGWLGVSVPEEAGGAGLGFVEEAVLFEELGRALYPGPYFATVALALPAAVARTSRRWSRAASGSTRTTRSRSTGRSRETPRAFAALARRPSASHRRRSSWRSSTRRPASSSASRSASTRRCPTRSSNTYVETELARSLAYWAAWCVAEGDDDAERAALAAKSYAAETAVAACERSIQVHGGIGFTWEHPLHRYYKRAQWIEAFGGYPAKQRAEIAASLLD